MFVATMGKTGTVLSVRKEKNEAEVSFGEMKLRMKISALSVLINGGNGQNKKGEKGKNRQNERRGDRVKVTKHLNDRLAPALEVNVIGKTVAEAEIEVEAFLDAAVVANLEEVRIVHGVGGGKLRAAVREMLRKNKRVKEFRAGMYGEGEAGVTIVKFK